MRALWYRLPLALKIALPMALLSLFSALTIVAVAQYAQQRILHERTDQLGQALASRLAANAARPLVQNDAVSLQATLAGFTEEPVVQRAVVFNLKQQLVAAAGEEKPDAWDYSTTIHWQDSAVGRAVLSLRPATDAVRYPQLGDLLILSLSLGAVGALVGMMLGNRAESLLENLTRKLSGEQIDLGYQGTDALARVLDTPPPPLLQPEPIKTPHGLLLLQLVIPEPTTEKCAQAFTLATAIGGVYSAQVHITRDGGITLRLNADDEFEGPFRAICCAQLLIQMGHDASYRIAIAALAATDVGDQWQEQWLIERLQRAAEFSNLDCRLLIDGQLQRHPTLGERCVLHEANDNFWQVSALISPYDTLLERQMKTLRALDSEKTSH